MNRHAHMTWLTAVLVVAAILAMNPGAPAATVTSITGTEIFTGVVADLGNVICPGHSPTGSWPPCPVGSRTHLRALVRIYADQFDDPRASGTNVVTENWNVDEGLTGPIWGTLRLTVGPGEVWEGNWAGEWHGLAGSMNAVCHGSGGRLEGLQLRYQCNYVLTETGGMVGTCSGEILDPAPAPR